MARKLLVMEVVMYFVKPGEGVVNKEPDLSCVVYDAKTGHVVHVHQAFNLGGAKQITVQELEAMALDEVSKRLDTRGLRVLHVPPSSIQRHAKVQHRVDLEKKALIAIPITDFNERKIAIRPPLINLLGAIIGGLMGAATFWLITHSRN